MSTDASLHPSTGSMTVSIAGLGFALMTTRNFLYLTAVVAMNYTLMRPSPVDLLFILSFLFTLAWLAVSPHKLVSKRAVLLTLLLGAWAVGYTLSSLPHLREPNVIFELIAKTFAISIGIIAAFVSMSWNRRHFETFMKVYMVSCVIASILGTIGFVTQNGLLTWDGRAKGLIDDPNMYGSFLIPAVLFCGYFLLRPRSRKLLLLGALGILLLGVILSFSRIALVATVLCLIAYVVFQNRHRPQRIIVMAAALFGIGALLLGIASLTSEEFTAKLLDRLTIAKSYDLGEEGRYSRYLLVLPMILQNPIGVGVLQLEKIFPEPIHNIWLSSFVNYGWLAGFAWITLVVSTVVVSVLNYRRSSDDISIVLMLSIIGIVMCSSLHEGEHWRHMWLTYGLVWGFAPPLRRPGRASAPVATQPAPG